MVCTEFDAVTMDLCIKAEHAARKYDKPFMDVLNRIMEHHVSWVGEHGAEKFIRELTVEESYW